MIIYTDDENRITSTGTKHEIADDHPLALMSEARRLCYRYEDNGSFYPYVSTNIIAKLETQADSNIDLALAVAELAETSASDKLDVEMAIAELAEVIMNG